MLERAMPVQRVEWQCPGCQRKFAIPSQQPRPKICPDCQKNAAVQQRRPAAATYPAPSAIEPELDFAAYPTEAEPAVSSAPAPSPRPVKRRRYEVLRTISLWFKIQSGMLAFLLLVALVQMGRNIFDLPPGDVQQLAIFSWLVTMIGGVTVVLIVYSFAVLLLVAMDIEHNTRPD